MQDEPILKGMSTKETLIEAFLASGQTLDNIMSLYEYLNFLLCDLNFEKAHFK
jgi:hypothetical protein